MSVEAARIREKPRASRGCAPMRHARLVSTIHVEMYAREIEEAKHDLDELRVTTREDLALAAVAFAASLVATQLVPELALPLFLGGVTAAVLAMRALVRRWELVDRLVGERDAYAIPQVLECAAREATRESRKSMAASIRGIVPAPGHPNEARIEAVAPELEALAQELEDDALELDPATAVACLRLFHGVDGRGPLFDELVSVDELRARIRHVRSGFTSARIAA
ncbi:MAG TPA: hypothetical protein VFK76_10740 [Gaiellaceae bacterium]|nr:hypothetical protein [Gaiellaceae bacterium]